MAEKQTNKNGLRVAAEEYAAYIRFYAIGAGRKYIIGSAYLSFIFGGWNSTGQ